MGSRMYVALVPPAEVLESVDDLVERMRERQRPQDPRRFRWIQPGDAHITLAFMASVADPEGLADSLTADLERVPPVEIGLSGSGAFPDPVSGRMLWLGIADPTGRLPGLARTIRSSAHSAGPSPRSARSARTSPWPGATVVISPLRSTPCPDSVDPRGGPER